MTTVRDIMTPDVTFCAADATAAEAAQMMAANDVGALPVCGSDGQLSGVVTDRDLALTIVAGGLNPNETRVSDLTDSSEVVTIAADASVDEAIRAMKDHSVRRLPVVEGTTLVGMVSQADIARSMPDAKSGDLVDAISSAPSNN